VLAAAAERTSRIRLTSAVTVLGSDDPVRVFQQFATLDLLSGGRAEIMAGRGSFTESFPLFGYDLEDYDSLFAEKLDLLLRLRAAERVTSPGGHRAPIEDLGIYPRPQQDPLPVWIAAGGTPESVVRTAVRGLPLVLAIVAELATCCGLPLAIASYGYVAETSQRAADDAFPPLAAVMNRIAAERGLTPMDRVAFDASRALQGSTAVGSPQQVVEKILFQRELFGHDRFMLHMIGGGLPHDRVMRSIELFGADVAPAVRAALSR
jgi:alkanesulfonate monooxygenase SsuD/methylene tetrahydromethanopterin reductase-like flavin-dependent oxidoreductase (luciferase family)